MKTIGNVQNITNEFEWKINDFLSLSEALGELCRSPSFLLDKESWHMEIYKNFVGCIDVYLYKENRGSKCLTCSLSLKTFDGRKYEQKQLTDVFKRGEKCKISTLCDRSTLLEKKSELVPSDILTIVCTLELQSTDDAGNIVTDLCSYCKKTLHANKVSTHEQKCLDKPIQCPACSKKFSIAMLLDQECQAVIVKDDGSLNKDYKKVLFDGKNHDLILKVGDKELRAHRDILMARSRVFESMFNHDMQEKKSGVIEVADCDPQAMELFLTYVYCGKVETLDQSNMLGLYYIADKYEMKSLKEECCGFIKKSLSITNICEVIQLALKHSDTGLLDYATEYFKSNGPDIMSTVEWLSFLKENLVVGNELLLKTFNKLKI